MSTYENFISILIDECQITCDGDQALWNDQYRLYTRGIRDVRIHDSTLVAMELLEMAVA